jgi:hypothetical protein
MKQNGPQDPRATVPFNSVADPDHFDTDPDPNFYCDTDPDPTI